MLGGGWLPLLLLPFVGPDNAALRRRALHLAAFAALWLAPQALIYLDRGGPLQRFALPASLGVGLVLSSAFARLCQQRAWGLVASAWLCVWLSMGVLHAIKAASAERAEAIALGRVVDDLGAQVGMTKGIVLVVPPTEMERAVTLTTLLGLAGRSDIPVFYLRGYENRRSVDVGREWLRRLEGDLHRYLEETVFRNRTERNLDTASVDAIVFRGPTDQIPERWRSHLSRWQQADWCAEYLGGNVRAGVLVTTQRICYSALVKPGSTLEMRARQSNP